MGQVVALDSNSLTYLIEAVAEGYLPDRDHDEVAPERLAMLRLYCYTDCSFWVAPTVQAEYLRIKNDDRRTAHNIWASYDLEDVLPLATTSDLRLRASSWGRFTRTWMIAASWQRLRLPVWIGCYPRTSN
jgi:hypothetical protein